MDHLGVNGQLGSQLGILLLEYPIGLFCGAGALFESVQHGGRIGVTAGAVTEFLSQVSVLVGEQPAFDPGLGGQLHDAQRTGGTVCSAGEQPFHGSADRRAFTVAVRHGGPVAGCRGRR